MAGDLSRNGTCENGNYPSSLLNWTFAAECLSGGVVNLTSSLCRNVTDAVCAAAKSTEIVKPPKPTSWEVWGYGGLFVLVVSLSSVVGVAFLPLMKRDSYKKVLMGMVGLAVGCLCGSAILHLIPQAFQLEGTKDGDTAEQKEAYLFKALVVIAAIYAFFLTERLLKLSVDHRKRTKHGREHQKTKVHLEDQGKGHEMALTENGLLKASPVSGNGETGHLSDDSFENGHGHHGQTCSSVHIRIPPVEVKTHAHEHDLDATDVKEHPIKTVAWMVITGDGIVDGLSMGAAFSVSVLSGITLSIAVLCEELPHELGDLAILLNSGMSLKKALLYNFLSACTCFLGLIVGILVSGTDPDRLGEVPDATYWIFALAGGMFLYISLVDMLPEMTHAAEEASAASVREGLWMLLIQNAGMVTGFTIMFLLARYAGEITLTSE
ncbi:Zinc transporter ZIP14 [Hypsibius exemplaris]|uniref:Zinc transporter ZIP14 n=1 Tax=Hypsibius exemplaris TaxID=2072580 RepID=A0A9X6RM95_HYPEX|nr:Zinc transporter ZIP14 [Hypsibius exemplaris]